MRRHYRKTNMPVDRCRALASYHMVLFTTISPRVDVVTHPATADNKPEVAVTLVHGTWGRGLFWNRDDASRWFEPGGRFYKELHESLTRRGMIVRIYSFKWSGANSVKERAYAAYGLAEHIQYKDGEHPEIPHFVIAHSHAGNVLADAISQMPYFDLYSCYLATPFIEFFPAKFSKLKKFALCFAFPMIAIYTTMLLSVALILISSPIHQYLSWVDHIYVYIYGIIFFQAFAAPFQLQNSDAYNAKLKQLFRFNYKNTNVFAESRSIIVRSIDDEASLVIALGTISSLVSYFIIYLCGFGILISLILRITHGLNITDLAHLSPYFNTLTITTMVCAVLIWAGRGTYGRELIFTLPDVQVNVQSSPDGAGAVRIVTLARPDKTAIFGLRHGIYDHPALNPILVDWIESCAREWRDQAVAESSKEVSR